MVKRTKQQKSYAARREIALPVAVASKPRHRMAPQDRERLILDNALRFFAERGLFGETRELARRLGVTQSLIYRYFPSKDVLIERVYQKWFIEQWNPEWPNWIGDRSQPLEDRLLAFYRDFARMQHRYEWVKLFIYSALNGLPHHVRFVARNREQLFPRIAQELRYDHHMPSFDEIPLTQFEHEQIWAMHATLFHLGQRRWLFGLSTPDDIDGVIATRVRSFVTAGPPQIAAHLAALRAKQLASG